MEKHRREEKLIDRQTEGGTGTIEPAAYDVFLSHNSADKISVEALARRLRDESGLQPWLDTWQLIPGKPWQEALEQALSQSRTCAIFIGPDGFGAWHREEMRVALDARVSDPEFRVIPVLLPDANMPERGSLPPFLTRHTWVDFRPGLDDAHAFHSLISGIKGVAPDPPDGSDDAICPYLGLHPFRAEDADYFFGRDALTQWLVEDVRQGNFLAIIGPSGSGKSSLAQAGLLPALRDGALSGSDRWLIRILTPGAEPVTALASQLLPLLNPADPIAARRSLADGLRADPRELTRVVDQILADRATSDSGPTRLLLLVDQFEEIFTICHDEAECSSFIAALLDATRTERRGFVGVLTMRADFYGRAAAYPELAARLERRQRVISPLDEPDLRRAIEEPARLAGLHFEKGLVDTLLEDAGHEPGVLPLVQHTLWELWQRRRGRWLTVDAYWAIGGVKGALANRAEEIYQNFTDEEQELTRRVLLRLTQPGEGTEDTRRRASQTELIPYPTQTEAVERVVQKLADARLLTTTHDEEAGQEVIDVSHEALIQGWPRLQGWVNEDRAGLIIHRRLTAAAKEWQINRRDYGFLYRGAQLAQAEEWAETHEDDMNSLERRFLRASVEAWRAEEAAKRRRLEWTIFGLATGLLIVAVLAGVAVYQNNRARREAERAQLKANEAQSVMLATSAGQALDNENTDLAIALALEATRIDSPPEEAERALAKAAYAPWRTRRYFGDHSDEVWSVAYSPDGRTALSGSWDKSLILWDLESGKAMRRFEGHQDKVNSVAISPDGLTALSGSDDNSLILWDLESGKAMRRFEGHQDKVTSVAISPDGRTALSGSRDRSLINWDLETGKQTHRFEGHTNKVTSMAFTPDGTAILSGSSDGTVRMWNIETGESSILGVNVGHTQNVESVAVSPDGYTALSGSWDNQVILWDLRTRTPIHHFVGHRGPVTSLAFSPNGDSFLSGSRDNTVRLWDIKSPAQVYRLPGGIHPVDSVAISPDGSTAVLGSWDTGAMVADVTNGMSIRRFEGHNTKRVEEGRSTDGRTVQSGSIVAISPDGGTALSASRDYSLVLWNLETGEAIQRFVGHSDEVLSVAISPNYRYALSGSKDRSMILWDIVTGKELHRFEGHTGWVWSVAFSPDGRYAVSGSEDKSMILWDLGTRTEVHRFKGHTDAVYKVAISPNGDTALTGSADRSLILWDLETGKARRRFEGPSLPVRAVAFSPDGGTILSGAGDNSVRLWDVKTGVETLRLDGHTSAVWSVAYVPDAHRIVSGSRDGSLILWRYPPPPLEELIAWTHAGRYVPNLSCQEPELHGAISCDSTEWSPNDPPYIVHLLRTYFAVPD
jgi:WD40 repeat protein/energy-coupling factor transporter ATP-binding protein EcfA2